MSTKYESLSMAAQGWYYDLISLLIDDAASDIQGSVIEKKQNDKVYLYDNYRVGGKMVQKYIGLKTDKISERLSNIDDLKQKRAARRRQRTLLVQKLKTENVIVPDLATGRVLYAFSKGGVFRLGGSLVGTNAFRAYELELGVRFQKDDAIGTMDVDVAGFERFSIAVKDKANPDIAAVLDGLGYEPAPSLNGSESWRWSNHAENSVREVEFLTPSFDEAEDVKYLQSLQVHAQSLHFMNYLLRDAMDAAVLYRDGILVKVPRPERYAIHKLIVASRREKRGLLKARKDLRQAEILMNVLSEVRPGDLINAYEEALNEGPSWREHIDQSFKKAPQLKDLVM